MFCRPAIDVDDRIRSVHREKGKVDILDLAVLPFVLSRGSVDCIASLEVEVTNGQS